MAKRKSQAELDREARQIAAGQAALGALDAGLSRKTFVQAPGIAAPVGVINADDLLAPEGFLGRQQLAAPIEPEPLKPLHEYGFGDFAGDFALSETLLGSALIMSHDAGFKPDGNWSLPAENSDEWKSLTDGLDPQHWGVFGRAVSAEHARFLRFKVDEELAREQRMMQYGGVAGVLAANVLNPENFLIGMSTGGLAWARTGSRLVRAMKSAGVATAENLALEGALDGMQESRDEWNYLYGAVAGIAMGGAFGALGRGSPVADKRAHADLNLVAQREAVARGLMDEADVKIGDLRKLEGEIRSAAVADRIATLRKTADGALSRTDLNKLRQQHATAELNVRQVEARRAEIERRMLDEDVAAMGLKEATSKARTKLRKASAKAEIERLSGDARSREGSIKARLKDAEKRAEAASEASRIEGGSHKDADVRKVLHWLQGDKATAYTAKLEKARSEVASALKISRKANRGELPATVRESFGADSASAARVPTHMDTSVRDYVPGSEDVQARVEFPETSRIELLPKVFGKRFRIPLMPRFDMANVLRGLSHEDARGTVGLYVGDPVGSRGGLNPIGASEVTARRFDAIKARFHSAYEPGFRAWLKETQGLDSLSGWAATKSRVHRKAFGTAVDLAIRTPGNQHHPSVVKVAARVSKLYQEMGQAAKDAGVKGWENFAPDGTYSPRVFDFIKIGAYENRLGSARLEEFVTAAIESGYRKAGIELDPTVLSAMGKGYFETLRMRAAGIDPAHFSGIKLDDYEQIAQILERSGVDPMKRAEVLQTLRNKLTPEADDKKSTVRYAKHRTILDESYVAKMFDNETGRMEEFDFRSIFMTTNTEPLFENYSRTMAGHTALAEVAGVRSRADHDALKRSLVDLVPDQKQRERAQEVMEDAYRLITGTPLEDTSKWRKTRRYGRLMRDYNFLRVMNQVGFAQIPDAAAYLTPQYLKYTRRYFPEVFEIMKRAQDGTLDHKLARELEEWIATGTDYHNNNLFSAFDDETLPELSKFEHAVRVGGRITHGISGLRHATELNQRLAGIAVANRLVSNIMGRTKDFTPERLEGLGLTPEKIARIKAQADQYVQFDKGGGGKKLMALELDRWDDPAALNDFLGAMTREARRMVQEEDVGDLSPVMHYSLAKIVTQFRRFPLVAYSKQLGHGIVNGDAETVSRVGIQIALGSLSYTAQMHLYAMTKPEEERAEFREKYLSPQAILFGGIFRAGMFSLAPQAIIGALDHVTEYNPLEHGRTTGLSSGFFRGIPAVDLAMRTAELSSDIVVSGIRADRQFDQKDFDNARRLLPFQNAFFVKQALDIMQQTLPDADDDTDAEAADFFLFELDQS